MPKLAITFTKRSAVVAIIIYKNKRSSNEVIVTRFFLMINNTY